MKNIFLGALISVVSVASQAEAQTFANFIRQVQFPGGLEYDATVAAAGESLSELAIDPGGARFELYTVSSVGPTEYLLDSTYVGTYIPVASLQIRSEDETSVIPRTRADRPFYVDINVTGIVPPGEGVPEPATEVHFLRHVQSYGPDGDGVGINRNLAILHTQTGLNSNGLQTLTFLLNDVPGENRAKVRGEERFSIFSLEDYQAPRSQLSSQYIQIWPVADGLISGITHGENIRFSLPQVTLALNDLYPNSTTYAQVYKGSAQLGMVGKVVPGSALVINDSAPTSRVLVLDDYESVFDSDGDWTMEIVTKTPFGTDRLHYVSFNLNRTIRVNGSFTTIE